MQDDSLSNNRACLHVRDMRGHQLDHCMWHICDGLRVGSENDGTFME